MSYEGYSQFLCANGHEWAKDCYSVQGFGEKEQCPVCSGGHVWENMVDVTNGSWDEDGVRIDGYIDLLVLSERKCGECGTILETVHAIPIDAGRPGLQDVKEVTEREQ